MIKYRSIILATLLSFAFSFAVVLSSNVIISQETCADGSDLVANAYLGDGSTETLFNKLVSDIDDGTYIDDAYASYYFSNLRENF